MLPDQFLSVSFTSVTGVGAIVFLTCGPAFRSRNTILIAQLFAGVCFLGHYLSLGIHAAAAANALGLVQTSAAIFAGRSILMHRLGYALIPLLVLSGFWFWQGPISALSVTAMALIALARMQTDELRLRLLLLTGGASWILHDLIGEAWFALTADIGAFLIGLAALMAMFVKVRVEWRLPRKFTPPAAVQYSH